MKRAVISGIILVVIGTGIVLVMAPRTNMPAGQESITVGTVTVRVDIAATSAAREQGLSGRASLPEGTGMLFVFATDGKWGFWMKDMNFPIDMLWIDDTGAVVTIAPSASPDSYDAAQPQNSQVFYPSAPARYVLEVPAGFAQAHNITVGTQVSIPTVPAAQ